MQRTANLAVVTTTQSVVYKNLTSTNDILVGIWNATVGGDSLAATVGRSNGQYPVIIEGPASAHDYDVSTKYNSYGSGNYTRALREAGVGTGFYVTMAVGACVVTGIQFATANDVPARDPITVTLEGSNIVNASLLSKGSSWTVIYSGWTGIPDTVVPSRLTYVDPQNFTNTVRYTSYRLIIASQRSISTNIQYSEAHLLGYV